VDNLSKPKWDRIVNGITCHWEIYSPTTDAVNAMKYYQSKGIESKLIPDFTHNGYAIYVGCTIDKEM
jgi:hypothetical protein